MPDIGLGEIIAIVVVALLVFGPDRLPKVAADAARTLRQVRQMAAAARKDLVDAAGLEDDEEMAQTVRDLRDLDPRRTMQAVLTDETGPTRPAAAERAAGEVRPAGAGPAPVAPPVVAPAPVAPPAAPGAVVTPGPVVTPPAPAAVDPDWT